jgi:RHS repeat-associated protein
LISNGLVAQTFDADLEQGLKPYGAYHGGDIDAVNMANGNLTVRIPLYSSPQRGGLKLGYTLLYNAKHYYNRTFCDSLGDCTDYMDSTAGFAGMIVAPDYRYNLASSIVQPTKGKPPILNILSVTDPTGASHPLAQTSSGIYESVDATGLQYAPTGGIGTGAIVDQNGTRYFLGQSGCQVEDANGNQLCYDSSSVFRDSLNRNVLVPSIATTDYSGCTGPLPISSAKTLSLLGPNGASSTFKSCYATVPLITSFNVTEGTTVTANTQMIQSVLLPDNTTWTFEYSNDGLANLTKITFPTGGTISYEWTSYETPCSTTFLPTPAVLSRTLNANDGTGDQKWQYAAGGPTAKVTDPLLNDTVYAMQQIGAAPHCVYYPMTVKWYQGSSTSGTLLKTETTNYSFLDATQTGAYLNYIAPVINVVPTSTTTSWINGPTSLVSRSYDSGFTILDPASTSSNTYHAIYGKVLTQSEYGYGAVNSGQPGSLIRKTVTDYKAFDDIGYLNNNLLSMPSSVSIYDGANILKAQTTYGYDESSLQSSGITVQHDTSPAWGAIRGNQTSVHKWLNSAAISTPSCAVSVSNGFLVSSTVYYDTGMKYETIDDCLQTTTYNYSSTFYGAYLTAVTNPLGQTISYNYDFNTGLKISSTDSNSQLTQYHYDSMWRLTDTIYPDLYQSAHGETAYTYNVNASPVNVTISETMSPSLKRQIELDVDGLGRVIHQKLFSNSAIISETDTTYDLVGHRASVSNPYQPGSTQLSDGITSFHYDALGRKTLECQPDNGQNNPCQTGSSYQQWSYSGNIVDFYDETRRHWQQTYDGLGRLTKVLEPDGGTNIAGAPVLETDYQYNALDDLTSVDQYGGTSSSGSDHKRVFFFDSLSRLVASSNPENASSQNPASRTCTGTSGTWAICYGYDANGNLVSKTDNRGVTSTYIYDTINRITGKSYSDSTPSVSYTYDTSPVSGAANTVGRLTGESVTKGNKLIAQRLPFAYDPVGRLLNEQQCTPINCAGTAYSLSQTYDLVGNLSSLTNGLSNPGVSLTYGYDGAARLISVISNWPADANHPSKLFDATSTNSSSPSYGPVGLLNAKYAINNSTQQPSITEVKTYDKRLRTTSDSYQGSSNNGPLPGKVSISVSGTEQSVGTPTPATGTVSISGSEQNKQVQTSSPIASSGSVAISGSLQSKQVQTAPGTQSTASVTIGGAELSKLDPDCPNPRVACIFNVGTISIIVNGVSATANYGQGSTTSSVASSLTSAINSSSGYPVSATVSGASITLTSKTTGVSTNYSLSSSSTWDSDNFGAAGFLVNFLGKTAMSGGQDAQYRTVYDSGSISLTVNGHANSTNWGQGSTAGTIASNLAAAINGDGGASISASASGNSLILQSKTTGASTNWPLTLGVSYDTADFSNSSFSATGSGMSGGKDAVNSTVYDSGTVTITVNGYAKSATFGQNDTAASIAGRLQSAIASDSSDPVTASVSGSNIALTTRQTGATVNYSLAASVSYDSSHFSSSSFSAAPSGNALTGGTNGSGPTVYNSGTVSLTINGTPQSVSYGNGDTASSVASKLSTAFSSNSSVSVSASGSTLNITAKTGGANTNYSYSSSATYNSTYFTGPSFTLSPAGGTLSGGADQSYSPATVYSYSFPASGGFDVNGNVLGFADSVMGQWSFGYDNLNRLITGHATSGAYNTQYGCWAYDAFGNRTNEAISTTACNASPTPTTWANFNSHNQISGTNLMPSGDVYDAAGNVTADGVNQYLYDAENRICAVRNITVGTMTQYIYDAEGNRVAKGTISTFSCDSTSNGFSATNSYVLGPGGEQISELNGSNQWMHTNVYAGGRLLATYAGTSTYFALSDWLGTKRVETTPDGVILACFLSLPFGNNLTNACGSGLDATEHHFTGKERDTESGNDYFMARYYSANLGRFMSPDWNTQLETVPFAIYDAPQSLNLYSYVTNNPLGRADLNGHGPEELFSPAPQVLIGLALGKAAATAMETWGNYQIAKADAALIDTDNQIMRYAIDHPNAISPQAAGQITSEIQSTTLDLYQHSFTIANLLNSLLSFGTKGSGSDAVGKGIQQFEKQLPKVIPAPQPKPMPPPKKQFRHNDVHDKEQDDAETRAQMPHAVLTYVAPQPE